MPNHLHAIISLAETRIAFNDKLPTISKIVAYYKYQTTMRINSARQAPGVQVWQRSFYDHIIRDENKLRAYRKYILENPLKWELDEYFG